MNYAQEVREAADVLSVEGLAVSDTVLAIAREAIHTIDQRYGPDSPNPLAFHNAPHSVGFCARGMRLINLLHPYIAEKWLPDMPDIVFTVGSTHDIWQQLGTGNNERASIQDAHALIDKHARSRGRKHPAWLERIDEFKERVGEGIAVTEVEIKGDGELTQTSLTVGKHDPAKFISAFGDINGIAMEGVDRMIRDALNLYRETNGPEVSAEGIANFLSTQSRFLRDRLYKNRVQSDLAYFFPDETMLAAYRVLEGEFADNIRQAAEHARYIRQNPAIFRQLAASLFKMADTSVIT